MRTAIFLTCAVCALTACTTPEPVCRAPVVSDGTSTFLISHLALEGVTGAGQLVQGFDLDGLISPPEGGPTCLENARDYLLAPDGDVAGIDAAASELVPFMESAVAELVEDGDPLGLDAAIARGHIVLLVQIESSPDGPPGDPILRVFRGTPADGSLELDATGRPMHGQRFRGELLAEGPFAPAGAARRAAIVTSFAAASSNPSPAPPLDLVRLTHVALDHCTGVGLRGRLGGSWAVEDAGTWFLRLGSEDFADNAIAAVMTLTDLDPDPADPRRCRRFSLGLSFEVVSAQLVE